MKMKSRKGFTLVELMVVILIVGILAAVAIPLMQGRIDKAKWSEANATAGTIRTAVRAYCAETSVATAIANVCTALSVAGTRTALGFAATDLEGTYFATGDYSITAINGDGIATIQVANGSKADAPTDGPYILAPDGSWGPAPAP
jgi:prepilin-type N-terminal cleavage/methylation domain-containing protein